MKKYDAIIIGFGKGGKNLAADLANHGWDVAVVERSAGMYGGSCINIGCIPTKALVHSAQVTGYRRPSTFEQYAEEFKQAILAKEKLTSLLREMNFKNLDDREAVAYSVFIDPPLAHVGLNEMQARKMDKNIKIASLPATAMPRSRTIGQTEGLLKAVVDADTGKILGCTLFCAESGEVINTVSLAMRLGQDYTFLRDSIFTHPSMSEALNDLFGLIK
ncbi:FAD-dependent oxidoreductase [Parabacteroides distasonis]|uniref:Pyridine nucleotide-disulfide oxidoreductase n=1 Tax=Parabacteroides distasonis TaxID=823 RepID=A0A4S2F543_PARDI|nr:FAD-dependent oxidoreductase [Parabacteroides distasonis]TGY62371.1 hypothetical protein E5342_02460 [Parabacteroides distasonis]